MPSISKSKVDASVSFSENSDYSRNYSRNPYHVTSSSILTCWLSFLTLWWWLIRNLKRGKNTGLAPPLKNILNSGSLGREPHCAILTPPCKDGSFVAVLSMYLSLKIIPYGSSNEWSLLEYLPVWLSFIKTIRCEVMISQPWPRRVSNL